MIPHTESAVQLYFVKHVVGERSTGLGAFLHIKIELTIPMYLLKFLFTPHVVVIVFYEPHTAFVINNRVKLGTITHKTQISYI